MKACLTSVILLFAATSTVCLADWRFQGETGVLYNSNLSNSDRSSDIKDDWAWRTALSATDAFQVTRDLRLNLAADLRSEVWGNYDAFNEVGVGISGGARYRFGLGRLAPWIGLENRIGYDRFKDTERSGYDELLGFRGGIGLTDRIAVEAGYSFQNFAAPDDFYDRQVHQIFTRAIFDVTSSLQFAVGYTYREGDVISSAVPPRPDIAPFAIEREDDDTFGTHPFYTEYKFVGRTHSVSVSAGYAITRYLSVQVSYEYGVTLRDPVEYENHLVEAKVALAY